MKKITIILMCLMAGVTVKANTVSENDTIKKVQRVKTEETATQFSNDRELLDIYNQMNAKPAKVKKEKTEKVKAEKTPKDFTFYQKKAKGLRVAGYVAGGAMICAGVVCAIIGDKGKYSSTYKEYYDANYNVSGFDFDIIRQRTFGTTTIVGISLIGGGAIVGTSCMLASRHNSKLAKQMVQSTTLWENGFDLKDGSRLNLGVDVLSGNTLFNKTVGLGFRYTF